MCLLILILFMLYFPSNRKFAPYIRHLHFNTPPTEWSIEWRDSIIVSTIVTIHIIFTIVITILLLFFYGNEDFNWKVLWAEFLGIASMVLISIQFIPQLYRTWRRKVNNEFTIIIILNIFIIFNLLILFSILIYSLVRWRA
jgi:hypothetical protein